MKQRRFVDAYTGEASGNATEAARIAGYKGDAPTLGAVGSENLRKPLIADAISRIQNDERGEAVANRQERREFLTRVMRGEELETVVTKDGQVIHSEPSMSNRLKALEHLGKMHGDFVTKTEHIFPQRTPEEKRERAIELIKRLRAGGVDG